MRRQDGLTFIYINIFQTALCQKGELRLPKKIFKKRKKKEKKSQQQQNHTHKHTQLGWEGGGAGDCVYRHQFKTDRAVTVNTVAAVNIMIDLMMRTPTSFSLQSWASSVIDSVNQLLWNKMQLSLTLVAPLKKRDPCG